MYLFVELFFKNLTLHQMNASKVEMKFSFSFKTKKQMYVVGDKTKKL